ncbi:MAG: bifunctional 2-polyprenyl-6-hydroxyphenol methylase/3-demethylubiquinol 3-O-methyltransferase UbiG [Gammaproteobacteria bacterium]|jgi:2-polyprenyl-6-hydroxyphenyl methylase/3-demethylubiquinone-9 3-methyltransferase
MTKAPAKPFSASVDMAEVEHYASLAHTWWDERGPFWPLHRLNALRVGYLKRELAHAFRRNPDAPQPLADIDLLDVGCGGGLLAEAMAALGARVHGIDVVEGNIRTARHHARSQPYRIDYDVTTIEELARSNRRYDVVLTMEVVEHVAELTSFMAACTSVVKPGGILAVATINRTWRSWLFAILGAEYVLRWLPRGTHQWRKFVRPQFLRQLLETQGFDMLAERGVRVNPLTRRFSTTSDLSVNYTLLAVRANENIARAGGGAST